MPVTSQGAPESVSSKLAVLGDHKDQNQYDEEKVLPLSRERQQKKETMGVKVIRYPSHHRKGTKENNSNILKLKESEIRETNTMLGLVSGTATNPPRTATGQTVSLKVVFKQT